MPTTTRDLLLLICDRFLPDIEYFKGADDLSEKLFEVFHIDPVFWTEALSESNGYFRGAANPFKAPHQTSTDWSMSMDITQHQRRPISELISTFAQPICLVSVCKIWRKKTRKTNTK